MNERWAAGVVVPARNEEQTVARCVAGIIASLESCPDISQSWIVVVADSCDDDTLRVARRALGGWGIAISCAASSVGAARKWGATALLQHFTSWPTDRLWIANTDADSYPGADWLRQQIQLAKQGYCGVAGTVRIDADASSSLGSPLQPLPCYAASEGATHTHVHGANLGIRADAYLDAGGWSGLALGEDHCLWSRIQARGWPVISPTANTVVTSGRLYGRARGGFADLLRGKVEANRAQ